ncbi:ATP-binding protein [Candidatus Pyrohabitans sp.]
MIKNLNEDGYVEKLGENEEIFQKLVEFLPYAITVHSRGRIVFVNSACEKLLGAEAPEQLIGKSIMDFVHPDYTEVVRERVKRLIEGGTGVPLIEERFVRLDGKPVDVEVAAVPFIHQGMPAVLVVVRDITERRQAEEKIRKYTRELEESQKALLNILEDERESKEKLNKAYKELKTLDQLKNDIIANVSHELRTPMTIAKGFAELALDEQDGEERRRGLMKIIEALEKQNTIVGNLIAMAEASKEKIKLHPSRFSARALISSAVEKKNKDISHRNIEMELQVEDFNVEGDFDKLRHVLVNLLDNAIKFNRPQGKITIKARKMRSSAVISVSDTGIGIPESILPKSFEPLFQGDASINRRYGGTGMGLAVVKTIVEAHDGEIYAESIPGEGSTFTLVLPLKEGE